MSRKFSLLPIAALIFALFGCFYGLGAYALFDNNEGLYGAIARNMALGGDLIIPHLNGVPYIEKPPMLYWLTALSFKLFGVSEWSARLVPALALATTIAACALFLGRRKGMESGACVALILSSSLAVLIIGRTLYFDMLFTCFLTLGLMSAYHWYESQRRRWLLIAYALLALAMLTKGVLALALAIGVGISFFVVERAPRKTYWRAFDPAGIALFLLIAVPWHVLASRADPGFAWFYFINEHVLRFLNMRQPHDYYTGPWWYYFPRVLVYLFPWSLFLPLLRTREHTSLERFFYCWFGWVFVFLSLSNAKANYYMIAAIPPLAMLLAIAAQRRVPRAAIMLLAGTIGITLPLAIAEANNYDQKLSQKAVAEYLNTHDETMPTGIYVDFEEFSALPFYLDHRPITVVDSASNDLLYGKEQHPELFSSLKEWLGQGGATRLVVNNHFLSNFKANIAALPAAKSLHMEIVPFTRVSVVILKRDGK